MSKPLSKPAIDRREHVECFLSFAPLGPKPGSRDASAQFKHLCALIDGNIDRALESRVSFPAGLGRASSSSSSPRSRSSSALHQLSWFLSAI